MGIRSDRFIVAAISVVLVGGCAQWNESSESVSVLPAPTAGPSVAIIDIAFVNLPINDDQVDWAIWNDADEQVLSVETRRSLAANGIRAGIVSGELPQILREQLDSSPGEDQTLTLLEQANLLSDISHGARRIHCRSDTPYHIPVRNQVTGDVTLLFKDGDTVIGDRFADPQFLFSLEVTTGLDGQSIVRLLPQIEHGTHRPNWVSNDQALRLDNRRESEVFESLAIEAPVMTDSVLLLTSTVDELGLGEQLFVGERVDGKPDILVLAIRMTKEPSPF